MGAPLGVITPDTYIRVCVYVSLMLLYRCEQQELPASKATQSNFGDLDEILQRNWVKFKFRNLNIYHPLN